MIVCENYGPPRSAPDYSYTGTARATTGKDGEWQMELLTSGTLTIYRPNGAARADIFCVGGGREGEAGTPSASVSWGYGGNGGRGGNRKTTSDVRMTAGTYDIVIGSRGNDSSVARDGDMVASSKGGVYAKGGLGGRPLPNVPTTTPNPGEDGEDGGPAFDEKGQPLYGGAGAGGPYIAGKAAGGKGGGGAGDPDGGAGIGEAGEPNKGAGGGGGRGGRTSSPKPGGPGSDGIIIIRKHKRRDTA